MSQVITESAHFMTDLMMRAVSPSYRRVRQRLAMIERRAVRPLTH